MQILNSSHIKFLIACIFGTITTINHIKAQCQYLDTLGIAVLQDSLADHFPEICKKVNLGTSVLGRDIIALKISDNVQTDENEPEILLTSCIHGDENNPEQVMMKFARKFCLDYATDPQTEQLVNNREIWIIAVVNPDGLVGHNYGHRPNANGIDLNRNYGYMWNAEDFDPFPYSEPETKLLRDFIITRNFNVIIDYHSGLQGIIYPWYFKTDNCPDFTEISFLAHQYDEKSGYPEGEFAVTCGADLYVTNGALVEFAYGSLGIYAFAVELISFTNGIYNDCELVNINKPSVYMMLEKAGEGIKGVVRDANTGIPIHAKITVDNRVPSYTSKVNGDYHRYLKTGNYSVTASANGYLSRTFNVSVSDGDVTVQDFSLSPDDNFSAFLLLTSRNFNNLADPAETWKALGVNDNQYYAIGDTGYVVLDIGAQINNIPGNDITVHGNASSVENAFELFYSEGVDGPWTSLGIGNSTSSYDIGNVSARYLRLEDNGMGPGNVVGAGFNLDAITIESISASINNNYLLDEQVTIYPNPFSDYIQIKTPDNYIVDQINILDNNGKLVYQIHESTQINLSSLPAGLYYIQLYAAQNIITKKLIKN